MDNGEKESPVGLEIREENGHWGSFELAKELLHLIQGFTGSRSSY